jgi:Zn-dependent protease
MLNKKEITSILIAILVITVSLGLLNGWKTFGIVLLSVFLVISINILAKKAISYYLDSKIKFKLWEIKKYWFKPGQEFKRPFPAGIFFPIIFSALSFGNLIWLASLVFEIKPKVYRAAKRHGLYSFSEVTEFQIGLIAAAGVLVNLIFAVIGYFAGFPMFAKLNIWLAFFNMIPISNLDGNKIFFGSLVIWSFLASIVLIGVAYVFLLV